MKKIVYFIFILLLTVVESEGKGVKPYNFSLKDENGNIVKLEDFKGNVVLITFWSTSCHTCREELPKLSKIQEEFKGKDVKIITVVINTKNISSIKKIKKDWGFELPVLIADSYTVSKYRIIGTPITYILRKDLSIGKIIFGDMSEDDYRKIIKRFLKEN
ncbi:TlpA family protein disulfide reductase [Persephonella sp.]